MGRKNCLKHVQCLTQINKLWNVASCWLYSANMIHGLLLMQIAQWCYKSTFFIHKLMHKWIVLKTILKFTLTQLWHVSCAVIPSSGSALLMLALPDDGVTALKHVGAFAVLLTVHLSRFISVINQLDAKNFCFTISLFHASTCFKHHVLIIRRSQLHYTASGIITLKQVSGLKLLKYNSINMSK